MSEPAATSVERALTFTVAGRAHALPATAVAEVVPMPQLARVPLAPPELRGLANVRGRGVPVLAVDALLGAAAGHAAGQLIVLNGEQPVGLAVTRVTGVVDLPKDAATDPAGPASARWLDVEPLLARTLAGFPSRRTRAEVAAPATAAAAHGTETSPFLTFTIAGQAYGLPLEAVREVMRLPAEIAGLPHTDPAMRGATDIRGRLVPVVSLRILLGFAEAAATPASRLVVVNVAGASIALLVDAVRAIVRAEDAEIEPAPSLLNRGAGEARVGTLIRSPEGLVAVLAPDGLFEARTTAALAADGAGDNANAAAEPVAAAVLFLRFWLGEESFGFPAEAVETIVLAPRASRAPHAPDFIVGLMNHRSAAVPLIDQRRRFGTVPGPAGGRLVIVTRVCGLAAGLLVDRADRVLAVPAHALAPAAGMLAGDARVFDRTVMDGPDGRPFLIVDPRELLDQAERDIVRDWVAHAKSAA